MKKINKALNIIVLLAIITISFTACDEDFTNLESGLEIENNFNANVVKYDLRAYTKSIDRVQTNNLPMAILGVYNDDTYGNTTTSFISQMSPEQSSFDPDFGDNVVLDSVVLTVPYFSTPTSTETDGSTEYDLDSIYGDAPVKLSIFRNNYFLRTLAIGDNSDDLNENLIYFSDGMTSEGSQINLLTDVQGDSIYIDRNFTPSSEQIILIDEDGNVTRQVPALRLRLDSEFDDENDNTTVHQDIMNYWNPLIIDKEGQPELSNQNNFLDYFRGLYFKAEPVNPGADGSLLTFNFTNANLVFHYTSDNSGVDSGDDDSREVGTFTINLSENSLNFFENDFTISDGDSVNGDESLFIKGGQGSFAFIDIFSDDIQNATLNDFLGEFKDADENPKRLINDAFIKFYVDQSQAPTEEPEKLYLYDINNNQPLIDYFLDSSLNKDIHLEPLSTENGQGISYKIRVTEYINNILLRDSTNLKLGLFVSNNPSIEGSVTSLFRANTTVGSDEEDIIPLSSIIEPRGTVLHGSNSNVPEELKLQLEIFYTEPEN